VPSFVKELFSFLRFVDIGAARGARVRKVNTRHYFVSRLFLRFTLTSRGLHQFFREGIAASSVLGMRQKTL